MASAWTTIIADGWSLAGSLLSDFGPVVALGVGLILVGWVIVTIRRGVGG